MACSRLAKEALMAAFPPNGTVPPAPSIKANMRQASAKFAELAVAHPQVKEPKERKWRDIRGGKYGKINEL
jgi:hypothetical protein